MRSINELKALKEKVEKTMAVRENKGAPTVIVHMGTCGIANGARDVLNAVMEELKVRELTDIHVTQTGCPGLCHKEPLVTVSFPGKKPYLYGKVTPENARKIILQHLVNGQPVAEWLVNKEE
ncbi:MAG: (2Fe-2S) ferredoxin domain-containing protein [Peptococcaceae bacterium]|jgi:(2Fe-2S) ferredoxin|nr:(2Fe-2S) ferredoxin domain-containing protein [Peptococcaceae bacterium]MDH7523813.1 (2Fe-2S) ferredoxin domain-containing protein [Peptococcaceae bacterium]